MQGTITKIVHQRGFGFIQYAEDKHIFFYKLDVQCPTFEDLHPSEVVEFEFEQDHTRAVLVRRIDPSKFSPC